ncbi:MAG: M3 family metallopeptidase, partial [Caulobacteraceae bacterium]
MAGSANLSDNPAFAPWPEARGGAPPFDRIETGHLQPALEAAMAEKRADVAAIVQNPEPPTFANTLEALEASGAALNRAGRLLGTYTSTMNDAAMRQVQTWAAPLQAALRDEIAHNRALFERIEAVHAARQTSGLDSEQQRLATVVRERFLRQGAALSAPDKARLAEINQSLAGLYTRFSQN